MTRTPYPSNVSDEELALVAPYLTMLTEAAPQRDHSLRDGCNGVRWITRTGAQGRMLPTDLPALIYRLSAHPALAHGGRLRGPGPRSAHSGVRKC